MTITLKGQPQPAQTSGQTPATPESQTQESPKKNRRPGEETPTPPQEGQPIEESVRVPELENDASPSQQEIEKMAELMYQKIHRSLDSAMITFKAGPVNMFVTVSMSDAGNASVVGVRESPLGVGSQDPQKVGFDATQVAQFFDQSKSRLLQQLSGEDLAALRAYINKYYPETEMKHLTSPYYRYALVSRADVEFAFLEVRMFIERLKQYFAERSKVLVNLAISSEPDNATFVMWPDGGNKRETTTNSVMANISRGLYIYKVTKPGHKDIVSTIDLVRESGTSLRCTFNKNNDKDGPHPCQVK
jgi:hypothetical protein